nr:hypothetical protein [Tanacetum cinerariifolium]
MIFPPFPAQTSTPSAINRQDSRQKWEFDQRVSALKTELSDLKQTNKFVEAVSLISGIVDMYLSSKMKEAVKVVDSIMKKIINDQVKKEVSKIMPKIEKYVTETLGAEVLVRTTNQPQTVYAVAASLSEFELKKILIDKIEANKSINRSDTQKNLYNALVESYNSDNDIITSYGDVVLLKIGRDDQDKDEDPSTGSNRGTKKRKPDKDNESSKDSRQKIIAVTTLTIMKKYDYGHLEEIEVRQDDQPLYKFKEGDFKRLRLQDIEEMLLLLVQQKLTNLTIDERYDLNVALCMFTRRIIIQKWVEDLQLGVKSDHKKLNLTKTDTYTTNLRNNTAYTSHSDPHGIIYVDSFRRKRLMRTNKLHKFSDGMLNDVRSALYDIVARIRMEYLPIGNEAT